MYCKLSPGLIWLPNWYIALFAAGANNFCSETPAAALPEKGMEPNGGPCQNSVLGSMLALGRHSFVHFKAFFDWCI